MHRICRVLCGSFVMNARADDFHDFHAACCAGAARIPEGVKAMSRILKMYDVIKATTPPLFEVEAGIRQEGLLQHCTSYETQTMQ